MYAVLFDIDGTLLLTGGSGHVAFARTFEEDFGVKEIQMDVAFAGRSDRAIARDLLAVAGLEPNEANWQKFKLGYLRRLPNTLEELSGRVLPGVTNLLDRLAEMPEVIVGLLTGNMRDGAEQKLKHYGLLGRFAFGGFGDHAIDRADIAREAVAAAEKHVSKQRQDSSKLDGVMVIGDTIHDIQCAKAVGAYSVAVPTGHTAAEALLAEQPDLLVDDLSNSQPLLEAIHAALAASRV